MISLLLLLSLLCVVRSEGDWEVTGKADDDHVIPLLFAVKQRNVDRLEQLLLSVSDPNSADYGKYAGKDQITELVGSHPDHLKRVYDYLLAHGISRDSLQITANKDFIRAHVSVHKAERMLSTSFHVFQHKTSLSRVISSKHKYTVPHEIADIVDYIGGVNRKPKQLSTPLFTTQSSKRSPIITPSQMRSLYQIPTNLQTTPSKSNRNRQAVTEFLEEYFDPKDLADYVRSFDLPNSTVVERTVGPNDVSRPGYEGSLDIQVILGVAPQVPTWYMSYGGRRDSRVSGSLWNQEPFLDWMLDLAELADDEVPLVHSVSYAEDEDLVPQEYMERVNVEFMKAGARGLTILVASGDDGCTGSRSGGNACQKSSPEFPSSSPFITSVGGTYILDGVEIVSDVHIGAQITSGGGFSNTFGRPEYQTDHLSTYLKDPESIPTKMQFNAHGRGFPDISAIANSFSIVVKGKSVLIGGTSASTPLVAGIVSLLNQLRLDSGRPPMGFINPWLYKVHDEHPEAFHDVTQGSNGCRRGGCCTDDFKASKGWDATTGLGTPNVKELINHL